MRPNLILSVPALALFVIATTATARNPCAIREEIKKLLADEDWRIRFQAARALWRIESDEPRTLAALKQRLNSPGDFQRLEAARALWKITGKAESVVSMLIELLKSEHPVVRKGAAELPGG